MDDYEAEFDWLSKFATSLVSDDESKARRFENGLNAHIHIGLTLLHLISYKEVLLKSFELLLRLRIDFLLEELNLTMARHFNKGLGVQCVVKDIELLNVSMLLVLVSDVANRAIILLIILWSLQNLNLRRSHKTLELLKLQCKELSPLIHFS
ncbi:hypothetical protein SCA6_017066 [Theobroma cacao]